jgi:hypothetical protein
MIFSVTQNRGSWWRRQQRPRPVAPTRFETIFLQESAHLPAPPPAVWSLVMPAENGPLFNPQISRGFRVPGTPSGLGEQQCSMHVDGTTSILEVVEYHETEEGMRAVTCQVSPPLAQAARTVHQVHAAPGGSVMIFREEVWAPAGAIWPAQHETLWHEVMADYFQRVRRVITSGAGGAG